VPNVRLVREFPLVDEYEANAMGWTIVRLDHGDLTRPSGVCIEAIMEPVDRLGGLSCTSGGHDDARSCAVHNTVGCG
jgi:hypothetical protein